MDDSGDVNRIISNIYLLRHDLGGIENIIHDVQQMVPGIVDALVVFDVSLG